MVQFSIITRKEAIAAGLTRFFTGRECANGHTAQRFSISGSCVDCQYKRQGGRRLAERELAKLHGAAGLTHHVVLAHADDWLVLEALANDMMEDRIATYRAANPIAMPIHPRTVP